MVHQGPEEDQEAESELTVTQLKELRKKQQMMLEKKMLGEDSDEDEEMDTTDMKRNTGGQEDEMGCTWGMGKTLKLLPEVNILKLLVVVPSNVFFFFNQASFNDSKYSFHMRSPKLREIHSLF